MFQSLLEKVGKREDTGKSKVISQEEIGFTHKKGPFPTKDWGKTRMEM